MTERVCRYWISNMDGSLHKAKEGEEGDVVLADDYDDLLAETKRLKAELQEARRLVDVCVSRIVTLSGLDQWTVERQLAQDMRSESGEVNDGRQDSCQ